MLRLIGPFTIECYQIFLVLVISKTKSPFALIIRPPSCMVVSRSYPRHFCHFCEKRKKSILPPFFFFCIFFYFATFFYLFKHVYKDATFFTCSNMAQLGLTWFDLAWLDSFYLKPLKAKLGKLQVFGYFCISCWIRQF